MSYMPYMRAASYESEEDFRASLLADQSDRATALLQAGLKPIKHITVVGANKPSRLSFQGSDEDSKRVSAVLQYMKNAGILIDPNFELDGVDFIAGRDFLREDHQTDMIFVSCILKEAVKSRFDISDKELAYYAAKSTAQYDPMHAFTLATCLSEHHSLANWQNRIEGSGAQIVWTFGGSDEVSSDYVLGPSYAPIVKTPNRQIITWKDRHETCESFYGDAYCDLPMLWLGCNMESRTLNRYREFLDDENHFLNRLARAAGTAASLKPEKKKGLTHARS